MKDKMELENDILIKKMLSESLEELPTDYMQNLNKKLELAHLDNLILESDKGVVSRNGKEKHTVGFKTLFSKLYEFLCELLAFVRQPRYGISLAMLVLVIAIIPQMGNIAFKKDGVYNSIANSGEIFMNDTISPEVGESRRNNFADAEDMARDSWERGIQSEEMKAEAGFDMNESKLEANIGVTANNEMSESSKFKSMDAGNEQKNLVNINEKKIIYHCNVNMETWNFEEFERNLNAWIDRYDAYIDSKNIHSITVEDEYGDKKRFRNGQIVIRLKSSRFFEALSELRGMDSLISENISTEDISLHYADTKQKKKNLEKREEALLKLMEKAKTMEDILMIDRELSAVREQIEKYGEQLLVWDDLVDYSTFTIFVDEVESEKPSIKPVAKGFREKVGDTFIVAINNLMNFFQNLILLIVYNSFAIISFLVTAFVLMGIFKRKRAKKMAVRAEEDENDMQEKKKS